MAPAMTIEGNRFVVTTEYVFHTALDPKEEKEKEVSTIRIVVKKKGLARRVKEALSARDTRVRDKNVTESDGQLFGRVPDPFGRCEEEKKCQMLTMYMYELKVKLVSWVSSYLGSSGADSLG